MTVRPKVKRQEIVDILNDALFREEPVVLTPRGLSASFFCLLQSVTEHELTVRSPIPPEMAERVMRSPGFTLFCRSYKIESSSLTPKGKDLVFSIPIEAELSQDRADERRYFKRSDANYILVQHPYDKGTVIKRQIIDLSKGGFSFRTRKITAFAQPGRQLTDIKLFVDSELSSVRNGKIVYVTKIIDPSGTSFFQIGVKFNENMREAKS